MIVTVFRRGWLAGVVLLVAAFPALGSPTAWDIDPAHSSAQFAVRHLMISTVRGEFSKVTGTVQFDDADVTKSMVNVSIDASTVTSREPDRDADLRSDHFLNVKEFPAITFRSKKVEKSGAGRLKVTGDLTIRGTTREVVLDVEGPSAAVQDPWGNTRVAVTATTKINRQDFGVKWNAKMDNGGAVVGDEVGITLDVEMLKKSPSGSK